MMNSSNLTGRLTKDPDLRYTPNGVAVATFTLAVNRPWTNEAGDREADFIQMVAFKGTAEAIGNYLNKGSLIGVEGRIQTRTYQNDDDKTVWVTEVLVNQVHFLDSKKEEEDKPKGKTGYNKNNKGGRK